MSIIKGDNNPITRAAKKVFIKMAIWKVPLMPENYHVWHEYVTGVNADLKEELDNIMNSGQSFDEEINNHLYDKYFGSARDKNFMDKVQEETQNIIKQIFAELIKSTSQTSGYVSTLETYTKQLSTAKDISEVQHVIKNIINDTGKIAETSRSFENKLKEVDQQTKELRQKLQEKEKEILIDPLTELHNRRAINEKLKELTTDFTTKRKPFSVIMLDIDHFKKFNDTYGHKVGDDVLKLVAKTISESVKGSGFPARFGGEEFIVLLPGASLNNACMAADYIRRNVSEKKLGVIKSGKESCTEIQNITVSLGVAQMQDTVTQEQVLELADNALYLAKNSGRNNVKSEKDLL